MKSRENLVRLKQFQVNEKRRQVAQFDLMIAEFERMAGDLEFQIAAEERRAGITDVNHFAYPTFAKAARQRRDNLKTSQADLAAQRTTALSLLREAEAELSKAQLLESRDSRMRDTDPHGRGVMIG
jgi:flagellar export protein FliJ